MITRLSALTHFKSKKQKTYISKTKLSTYNQKIKINASLLRLIKTVMDGV
jgi:hypothetical protein